MDVVTESGRSSASKQVNSECKNEQADAGRDGRTCLERQVLRRERGQEKSVPVQLDHEQDLQSYSVDLFHILLFD